MKEERFICQSEGNVIPGKVTGITNFGVFVDLGDRKTGLVPHQRGV